MEPRTNAAPGRMRRGSRSRVGAGAALLAALALLAPASAIAATSGGWSNVGHGATATSAPINERVLAFTRVGSKLYVGGQFTNAGGIPAADRVAVWNGSAWAAVGAGLTNGSVNAIAVDGTKVYVGGSFTDAGGDANADNLAVWDGTGWHAVGGTSLNGPVWALAVVGGQLIVGGAFQNVDSITAADGVAAYGLSGGGWSAIAAADGDITGTVFALAPDGAGGAWVGGYFGDVDGISTADYVAHWTGGTSWSDLGGVGLNGTVRALAPSGSGVIVAGDFTNAGGINAADKIARFDGATWSALGSTSEFGEGASSIYGVATDGPRTIAVGIFLNAGGNPRADGVAFFNGATWSNLGTNAAGTGGPAISLRVAAVVGRLAYVGGLDTSIGGGARNVCLASFRLRQPDATIRTTGSTLGGNVYGSTGSGQHLTLAVRRGAAGTFTIRVGNDGGTPDTITLKGPGSAGGFTATWSRGTTPISAAVVAGTYTIPNLAPGAQVTITLRVRVGASVAVGAAHSWLLTASSTAGGAPRDAVKATVRAR